jgi:hypothetical protein
MVFNFEDFFKLIFSQRKSIKMEHVHSSVATKVADLRIYSAYLGISIFILFVISRYFVDESLWYLILCSFSIIYLLMNIYLLVISYQLPEKPKSFWRIWRNVFTGISLVFLCLYAAGLF